MNTTKALRSIIAMFLALALLATACGSSSDDTVASGDDTTTAPAATEVPAADDEPDATESADEPADDTADEPADEPAEDPEPAMDGAMMTDGPTLTVAVDWDVAPRGFDGVDYASELFPFYSLVYDALFMTNVDGDIVPSLVEEFSQNEETTNLVMKIKEGAVFADGTPLDAAVVKANLDRRDDPTKSGSGGTVPQYKVFLEGEEGHIDEVLADGQTVTINFTKPVRSAHELLADAVGIIVNPAGLDDIDSLEAAPNGSGAFELVADNTTRGNTYAVTKKASHWNSDAFAFDNVVFDIIVDPQARANAVISGQADLAIDIAPSLLDLVDSQSTLHSLGGVMGSIPIFDKMGTVTPEFEHLEVRHAISYAIDREKIVEALVPGGRATSQMFPKAAVGYDPALDDKYAYDPDKARELMASVGLEDGFEFDFVVLGAPKDMQLAVQQMLAEEINIQINWDVATSTDALFASTRTQPMAMSDWALGSSPAGFIKGPITTGFMNHQGYSTEAVDAVMGPSLGGNPEALRTLNETLVDEGWWISLYESNFYSGYDSDTITEPTFAGTNNWMVMSGINPA